MRTLIAFSCLFIFPALAIDGSTTPQGMTEPSSTGIMGGGTPGRSDSDRMSKKMYNYEDNVEEAQEVREALEEEKETKKDHGENPTQNND